MKKYKVMIAVFFVISVCCAAFIFANSLQGGEVSNAKSDTVVEKVKPIVDPNDRISLKTFSAFTRKSAHFVEFTVFGVSLMALFFAVSRLKCKNIGVFVFPALFTVLLAGDIDEFIQSFTGRTSMVKDVFIDFAGGSLGIAAVLLVYYVCGKMKSGKTKKIRQ